mmetsp:Transcript_2057/g.3065  ORF Transcript_2057/g.3065 Transcript_2057/m.3065 type:complete len:225 (+) Transcript_2057:278-952(+)
MSEFPPFFPFPPSSLLGKGELALLLEAVAECGDDELDVLRASIVAHDADAPDLSDGGTEATGELHTVGIHGVLDQGGPVNALRDLDGVDGDDAVLFLGGVGLEAELGETLPELGGHILVALPHILEPLFGDEGEGLAESVEGADGPGVVVEALVEPAPVVADQVDVEGVGLGRDLAVLDLLEGTLRKHEGGGTGRGGETLLGATVGAINTPLVGEKGNATEGGN